MAEETHTLHLVSEPPIVKARSLSAIHAITGPAGTAIMRERMEQVETHGYDAAHDDMHTGGEIAGGALAYAMLGRALESGVSFEHSLAKEIWPFPELMKPTDAVDCYVKAAAMLMAEVDRLMRARALNERMD